jgi:hypothetical protein
LQQERENQLKQVQEFKAQRFKGLDDFVTKQFASKEKFDPSFKDRRQKIVDRIFSDPENSQLVNDYVEGRIDLDAGKIVEFLDDLDKQVLEEQVKSQEKQFQDWAEKTNQPFLEAKKQAAASASNNTVSANSATPTSDEIPRNKRGWITNIRL